MGRTYDDSPIVKAVKRLIEAQRKEFEQARADMAGFVDGAVSQLTTMLGSEMSVQAAMIEYLEELSSRRGDAVGAELRIKSIVEQNIAQGRAKKAEREKAEAEAAAKRAQEAPADIAPEAPADAPPADPPGSPSASN